MEDGRMRPYDAEWTRRDRAMYLWYRFTDMLMVVWIVGTPVAFVALLWYILH